MVWLLWAPRSLWLSISGGENVWEWEGGFLGDQEATRRQLPRNRQNYTNSNEFRVEIEQFKLACTLQWRSANTQLRIEPEAGWLIHYSLPSLEGNACLPRGQQWMNRVINHAISKPRNEKISWLEGDTLPAVAVARGLACPGGSVCSLETHQLAGHSAFQLRRPASRPPGLAFPGQTTKKQTPLHPGGVLLWPEVASPKRRQSTRKSTGICPKGLCGPVRINHCPLSSPGLLWVPDPSGPARGPGLLMSAQRPPTRVPGCHQLPTLSHGLYLPISPAFGAGPFGETRMSHRIESHHPGQDRACQVALGPL